MSRTSENTPFACGGCGRRVPEHAWGSYRNHCPYCLASLHVDELPGDRASTCQGLMAAIGLDYDGKKGFMVVHRCTRCGHVGRNKAAPDDDIVGFQQRQAPPL